MPIVAEKAKKLPVFEEGVHPAVVKKVEDLGLVKTTFAGETKEQHKVRFTFGLDGQAEPMETDLTLSLDPKARLYQLIVAATGAEPSARFDVETLVGKKIRLSIVDQVSARGNKYSKIDRFLKPAAGAVAPKLAAKAAVASIDDSDVPF